MNSSSENSAQNTLVRNLGFPQSFSLVVGTVIGTGVFLKAATMSNLVGSSMMVLVAWIAAGILSLIGAFCYAEIGSRFPRAGGEYVYLKEAYGDLPAFLFGWMRFWIASPGSIAAYGVGAATFLKNLGYHQTSTMAIAFILIFTVLNCFSVKFGGAIQTFITALKILIVIGIALAIFSVTDAANFTKNFGPESPIVWNGWSSFGMAMLAALWAFDGWNNMPMAAGEIHHPEKNIPRALVFGMLGVLVVYLLANLAYYFALPFSEVVASYSKANPNALPVAARAAGVVLGESAAQFLTIAFVISALGAMNGSILTGARVPYAMSKDGLFFKSLGKINSSSHSPVLAVIAQGIVSVALALSGSFDQLTDYVVFASWIFYGAVAASIFIFRNKEKAGVIKTDGKIFRTPFYPWVPALFIISSLLLLINTLINSTRDSLIGLAFIVVGIPVFFYFKKRA